MDFHEFFAHDFIDLALDRAFLGNDPLTGHDAELRINILVREQFLDKYGRFEVDPSLFFDFAIDGNNETSGVIFQGHDMLTIMVRECFIFVPTDSIV